MSPGSAGVYPVFGVLLTGDDDSVYNEAISPPVLRHFEGHHYYTFIYCGAEWYFRISSHANPPLDGLAIQTRRRSPHARSALERVRAYSERRSSKEKGRLTPALDGSMESRDQTSSSRSAAMTGVSSSK